jgi:hypothetical protein
VSFFSLLIIYCITVMNGGTLRETAEFVSITSNSVPVTDTPLARVEVK